MKKSLWGFIGAVIVCANAQGASFVKVLGTGFFVDRKPYRFVGANFWQGANLGSQGPGGDRARLVRELDRMKAIGVTNLRILAASQGPDSAPYRIHPSTQPEAQRRDQDLLEGLDFLLAEMGKRDMRAVVVLNNFWHWSGGMSQLLNWVGAGGIPYPPPFPGGSWDAFQRYTEQFYTNAPALKLYNQLNKEIITRVNTFTQKRYSDDPTIMTWQLANEPRGMNSKAAFNKWIDETSRAIRSLAPRQLISTGVEGETPWPWYAGMDFFENHKHVAIDYATVHIWVQNWNWFDPALAASTYDGAVKQAKDYLMSHLTKAAQLGKPVVLEEFGIARDKGSFDPWETTVVRDRYYREVFETVVQLARSGSPLQGANFWAWGGEARPRIPYGSEWKMGDSFLGDPPHEPQGWYSVYDSDADTLKTIAEFTSKICTP
jgi:mannan endo-1,4-beta-mannosidase